MENKKLNRIIIYIIIGMILILPTTSKAVLQANGGAPAKKNINTWLLEIRQMQATGGALGLTDTINSNLTSTNKNLDIHMQKNTEYGAMAILSASSYGKPDKVNNGETTTGNSTGIKININNEWVVAGNVAQGNKVANFKNSLGRYKNIYTNVGGKVGDTINIGTWHGGSDCTWINYATDSGIVRSHEGSLFSYNGYSINGQAGAAWVGQNWSSRAVVVVGSGI